jgi:hypothetical protein
MRRRIRHMRRRIHAQGVARVFFEWRLKSWGRGSDVRGRGLHPSAR